MGAMVTVGVFRPLFQILNDFCPYCEFGGDGEWCTPDAAMHFSEDPGPWIVAYLRDFHTTKEEWEPW